jgi:hypothetical protein
VYRSCIYCSAGLGANEALEAFPVGKRIAFDAARGRLWAVCAKCGRWNLAPIEERWEPVEEAERLFRDARLRAQSENIGLAKLRDGTHLIRVGQALQGELAAWRYGDQLVRRRRHFLIASGAVAVGGLVVAGGMAWALASGGVFSLFGNAGTFVRHLRQRRVFDYVPAGISPTGRPLPLRRWHLNMARLTAAEDGSLALRVPNATFRDQPMGTLGRYREDPSPLLLPDADARRVLARGAVHLNAKGANRRHVGDALGLLAGAGSAEGYLRRLAAEGRPLRGENRRARAGTDQPLERTPLLALEMALHEEQERRALEGELAVLEAAWRDAEEIAAIADRLAAPELPGGA